jgi:type IV secretion system protein VirB6
MSFLSDFETQITTGFTAVVDPVAAQITTSFQPVFVGGFSIWILLITYDVAWGKSEDGMTYIMSKFGKMFLIGTFALYGWSMMQGFMQGLMALFVSSMSCSVAPPGATCGGTVSSLLETTMLLPLGQMWVALWGNITDSMTVWSVFSFSIFGKLLIIFLTLLAYIALTICVAALCIITLAMYMVAYAMFMMLMAVGPVFLMCMAFPVVQRFFETWVGAVVTTILAAAFTALLAVLSASVIGLNDLVVQAQNTTSLTSYQLLVGFLGKCGFALLLVYLYYKVFDLASSLGGGLSLGNNMVGAVRALARDINRGGSKTSGANTIGKGRQAAGGSPSAERPTAAANRTLTGMAISGTARAATAATMATARTAMAGGRAALNGSATVGRYAYNRGLSFARRLG